MLIRPHGTFPKENVLWKMPNATPWERYATDPDYRKAIDDWAAKWQKPGPHKFNLIRMIRGKTSLQHSLPWWEQGPWEECLFWVFFKPLYYYPEGKKPYGYYCLEFFECQRVIAYAENKLGYNPFPTYDEMLMIPIELCHHAARWETSGGVSDHLRPREEIIPTQQEIDREARIEEGVKILSKEIVDIEKDPRFKNLVDAPGH